MPWHASSNASLDNCKLHTNSKFKMTKSRNQRGLLRAFILWRFCKWAWDARNDGVAAEQVVGRSSSTQAVQTMARDVAQTSRSGATDRQSIFPCVSAARCAGASHLRFRKKRRPHLRRTGWPLDPPARGTVRNHHVSRHVMARDTKPSGSRGAGRPTCPEVVAMASSHAAPHVAVHKSRAHAAVLRAKVGHVSSPIGCHNMPLGAAPSL